MELCGLTRFGQMSRPPRLRRAGCLNHHRRIIDTLKRKLRARTIERASLHIGADVVSERGHIRDRLDPVANIKADRFAAEANLNGPMRQRREIKTALRVPLDAHRRGVLEPRPGVIVQTVRTLTW